MNTMHTRSLYAYIFFILCVAPLQPVYTQDSLHSAGVKTTVLIAGTLHWLPWPVTHNYNYIEDASVRFQPDVICIEYALPEDTLSIKNFYGTKTIAKADSLRAYFAGRGVDVRRRIDSLYGMSVLDTNVTAKAALINLLYAANDFGNSAYQNYLLFQLLDELPKVKRQGLDAGTFEDAFLLAHKRDEFGRVIYPLAKQRGIQYLYPIDDHTYEKEYNESMEKASADLNGNDEYQAAKSRLASLKWGFVFPALWGNLGKKMNSYDFQDTLEKMEAHMIPPRVSDAYDNAAKCFEKRNELMAANIAAVVKKHPGKRVAVFAGASHVPFLRRYLQKYAGIVVQTLPDLEKD